MNELLQAIDLKKSYFDGPRVLPVLKGINLAIPRGEAVSIVGASGAGKTTLLHLLGALDRPTSGEILFDAKSYGELRDTELARIRNRRIGVIYQFHHLLSEFNALENVMIPALINGHGKTEIQERARRILADVGLAERLTHRPAKLSGGEQQRVALARALINNPDLILADEPTGDLDLQTGAAMIELIWQHTVGKGKSLIIVTHDPEIAGKAHRSFRLHDGILIVEKA
jgi:lipoprotein-releasing system ATP-binding protein